MDADLVPAVMVEAAARLMYNADHPSGTDWWAGFVEEEERLLYRIQASGAVAAALSVCEAREEWGHRSHWDQAVPPRSSPLEPASDWDLWYSGPMMARAAVSQAERVPRSLIRRWVFTTPAEPVPDGDAT